MTDIIIYYSRTGKTKYVADILSNKKDMENIEIKDLKNRSGTIGFLKGAIETITTMETEIKPKRIDLKKYDTIYIGTPVWASKPAPAIKKIINNCDFKDKKVVTFATFNGSGAKETLNTLNQSITDKGGKIIKSFAIITKKTDIEKLTLKALKDMDELI